MKGSKNLPVYVFVLLIMVVAILQAQFSAAATFNSARSAMALAVTNTPTEEGYPPPEDTNTPTTEPTDEPDPTATNTVEPTDEPDPTATNTIEPTDQRDPTATNTPEPTDKPDDKDKKPTATKTSVTYIRPRPGGAGNLGMFVSIGLFSFAGVLGVIVLVLLFNKKRSGS